MSKSVLISIKPKWCELIANGKKTVEVRKSRPKLETPFKCYIYCTKNSISIYGNGKSYVTDNANLLNKSAKEGFEATSGFSKWNSKVIGEFVCDTMITDRTFGHDPLFNALSCMTIEEIASYCTERKMYGWHISDLKIYDKPKELREFYKPCIYAKSGECIGRQCDKALFTRTGLFDDCGNILSKPPQSWCYVEEDTENA